METVDKSRKKFAKNNNRFQILTDTGFSDFIGVLKTHGEFNMIEHKLDNGDSIKTTPDHMLYDVDLNQISSGNIDDNTKLYGIDGKPVYSKGRSSYNTNEVYDILHAFKNNRHYANGILIKQCLYIDEIAFIPNVEQFYESVFPTISSSNKTKVIVTSTPLGMNYFYKMWTEAEYGRSAYVPYDVKWYEHPERDQKWYDTMCASMSATAIEQEMNCVGGDTKVTINGSDVSIESLYNKFNKKTDNVIAYVTDINIDIE